MDDDNDGIPDAEDDDDDGDGILDEGAFNDALWFKHFVLQTSHKIKNLIQILIFIAEKNYITYFDWFYLIFRWRRLAGTRRDVNKQVT